jgi:hypothetical protein
MFPRIFLVALFAVAVAQLAKAGFHLAELPNALDWKVP